MSEWDYTNERVMFWMDLNGDFEWVCSTITSQNIYGRAPTIILLTMKPSRLFVKIRCHAVPSTRKRSAVRNNMSVSSQPAYFAHANVFHHDGKPVSIELSIATIPRDGRDPEVICITVNTARLTSKHKDFRSN
ncbi:core histone macro-H2A.1 [Trichonephila clavipes]|uniref:Core histone macro-H2A.1 n=1 Tax=Trichonephila clavipes TaxID=2585209 RepID=A0A8X6SGL2_TRICX|nr:core histone macro-H2A.1 [Trichonephila clavipes]